MAPQSLENTSTHDAIYKKIAWRIMPFLFLVFMLSYLDRVNIGYAKLQFAADIHISETVFGFGAGLFFFGYFFFEVPSNLILRHFGARVTISRIMITWGLMSAAMMFVRSEYEFYILRFLLGVAEAGLVPGVILYLTFWFPANRRAGMVAIFLAAIPASGIIGAPLSGFLMNLLNDWNGLAGWKWMFLLEGIPSVLVGLAAYWYLDNGPEQANWLTTAERSIVKERLDYETKAQIDVGGHVKVWTALGSLRFWALTVIYFGSVMGVTGLAFWLPQIVRDLGVTNLVSNGLITSLPYIAAAIGMLIVGWSSDRTGERRWHYAISSLVGGLGLVVAGTSSASNPTLSVIGLALAAAGIYGGLAIFWSMSTSFLQGVAAAAGIAVINSISNLGGFVGPQMIGIVRDATHRTDFGLYFIAVFLVLSGAITLSLPKPVVRLDQVPMGETKDIGVSVLSET